jgi:hypothetical protein
MDVNDINPLAKRTVLNKALIKLALFLAFLVSMTVVWCY